MTMGVFQQITCEIDAISTTIYQVFPVYDPPAQKVSFIQHQPVPGHQVFAYPAPDVVQRI